MGKKHQTPLLDELKKGKWISFVREIERAAEKSERTEDLLGQVEESYRDKVNHWKHGGMAGVKSYGAGMVGRFSEFPDKYPGIKECHSMRIIPSAGFFYNSDFLRKLADISEKYAGGLLNFHGATGNIQVLGMSQAEAEDVFQAVAELGFDLGGSGSDLRTPSCCAGQARCEFANYDTMKICHDLTEEYLDELHRPAFNYKFKLKFSGCANDCVASAARSDLAFIGTWKDKIKINQDEVKNYVKKLNVQKYVLDKCPTKCMWFEGEKLVIDDENCVKCMHCINVLPKALRSGDEKGASILIGAKAPLVTGPRMGMMLVPFYDINEDAKNDYEWLKGLISNMWEFWDEYGVSRERIGELIGRVGLNTFLEGIGLEPIPEMVGHPRSNPFIKFTEDED
ncbi:MAG: dissimilatory-type sulfite reductase subunit alpha [Deltaproteobacteria bacterium]|nr:dissimilatory-type sulfite reductase subunit alpha [Deltaproteobacteria bacterium]